MQETVRYSFRLRPGSRAERALLAEWDRCRWIWNECVSQQRRFGRPSWCQLGKMLTEARQRSDWLREGSRDPQGQVLRWYDIALRASFETKGRGKPGPKKKGRERPSFEYTERGFRLREGRLCLAKGVSIPVVWSRDLPSTPKTARVYQDSLGHWYVAFVVRREVVAAPEVAGSVGIDWGVKTTATASDERYDLPYAGVRRRAAKDLRRARRRMSRRCGPKGGQKTSKGYQQARRRAAKIHKRAQRQNLHIARQWAKRVVAENQIIGIENLRLAFLDKTKMAKKANDAAIGVVREQLVEYAERAGRKVVLVEPAYTTMTCGSCLARAKQRLPLDKRTFRCEFCGHTADRDRNAARVIRAVAERNHDSADGVSRCSVSLAGGALSAQPELVIPREPSGGVNRAVYVTDLTADIGQQADIAWPLAVP